MSNEFVHLHCHTEYSLLDGLTDPKQIATRAKEFGMPAVALTDHGTMFGAIEFHDACRDVGVKPIIGIEAYLARRTRTDRDAKLDRDSWHLLLLAENETGYKNLLRLASLAQLEGFYYYPRVDKDVLAKYSEGVICTSGCLSAEVPDLLKVGRRDAARQAFEFYRDVFGNRFYVELQDHNLPELKQVNRTLVEWAREFNVPLIATNDVHYLNQADAFAQDILLCIQTQKTVNEPDRMKMSSNDYYFKSPDEMAALWREFPEALTNTLAIAERCNVDLSFKGYHLPIFPVPDGYNPESYLRTLCEEGFKARYPDATPEMRERLNYELSVIHQMGFDTYFLIVWDLTRYAREADIWYNIRGSAAGSMVAYCLGITNLDPLPHRLVFERFLNPGRITMPDIDMDFPDDRREQMIAYTVQKYGKENVAQIITFGKMLAKAALRDVGRVMDYPLGEVDRVAKLIPIGPHQTIDGSLEKISEFKQIYDESDYLHKLIDTAKLLEGVARNASTHAAGVLITDKPVYEYTPLHRPTRGDESGFPVTQFPMGDLERVGLLKMDFLGLATLTIMRRTCEMVEKRYGIHHDLNNIPVEDAKAFELLSRGDVQGVFQVEGAGMRRVLTDMQPNKFDHIVATISLYRPGPMEYIPSYIKRLHGEEPITYKHPKLEAVLAETYGIIVYQEQIIQAAVQLAGYKPGEADEIRKAVGKKIKEKIEAHRVKFVKGCVANGIDEATASAIYGDIEYFARYGFNKAHAADYAVLTCQTAFLKAHYPLEYMCAILTNEIGSLEKIASLVAEARRANVPILPPDVRYSQVAFEIDYEQNGIRFGLSAIKNVGTGPSEVIVAARHLASGSGGGPFTSLDDFCRRVDLRQVNRRVLESLVRAGALDGFGERAQLLAVIDRMLAISAQAHDASARGQMSFFGTAIQVDTFGVLPDEAPLPNRERLSAEKELIGVYFSETPITRIARTLRQHATVFTTDITEESDGQSYTLGGIITSLRTHVTKKGDTMAFANLEDPSGVIDLVLFPRTYGTFRDQLYTDALVLVTGKAQARESKITLLVEQVREYPQGEAEPTARPLPTLLPLTETLNPPRIPTSAPVSTSYAGGGDEYVFVEEMEDDWIPPPEDLMPNPVDAISPSATATNAANVMNVIANATPVEEKKVASLPAVNLGLSAGITIPSKANEVNGVNGAYNGTEPATPFRPSDKDYGNGNKFASALPKTVSNSPHGAPSLSPAVSASARDATMKYGAGSGRRVHIHFARTDDYEVDKKRIHQLFSLLTRAQGVDRFYLYIPNANGLAQVEFPNNTTNYVAIEKQLASLAGEWTRIEVE